jgi:hypothetical protein
MSGVLVDCRQLVEVPELNEHLMYSALKCFCNMYERVMMPHVVMRCVHRCDYDTNANAESPTCTWPDAIHDGVVLDDEKRLQMFDACVSTNPHMIATSHP